MSQSSRFKFNTKSIEKLPPNPVSAKSREAEYSDTDVTGLKLLVGKNGSKKWLLRYNWHGRKRSVSLGTFPSLSVNDARIIANQHKGDVAKGIDPKKLKDEFRNTFTLTEFFEQKYWPHANTTKKNPRQENTRYHLHIKPKLGYLFLTELTSVHIYQLQQRLTQSLSSASNNRVLALLRHMLNMAVQWGVLRQSPIQAGFKLLRENNVQQRFLSPPEIQRLFMAAHMDENYYAAKFIQLAILTGARSSELRQAKWIDMELESSQPLWLIRESKSGKARYVYLNHMAVEILNTMHRVPTNDYVFVGAKQGKHLSPPHKAFKRILRRAKLDTQIRIHDLRHTTASLIVNNGGTLYDVQAALGHSSSRMSERYAHLSNERLQRTSQRVANVVETALSNHRLPTQPLLINQ